MALSILLRIASLYMALAGLGFIFAPQAFGTGAVPANPSPPLIAHLRLFGGPLLGIAVMDWRVRDAEPSATRDAIVLGNVVGFAAMAVLDTWGVLSGARPVTVVFAVVHFVFAAAFIWAGRTSLSAKLR